MISPKNDATSPPAQSAPSSAHAPPSGSGAPTTAQSSQQSVLINGQVFPPVLPPTDRPGRCTNQLVYLKNVVMKVW